MNYFLTLSFVISGLMAESQCCPYMNGIEVIPAVPSTTDNVKIVTTVTTPNQGAYISSSFVVNGNTIHIDACYFSGFLTATQTYYDTLVIGMLNAGVYTIDLTAYQSTDLICDFADTNTASATFTVLDQTNEITPIEHQIGRIYPNPTSGSFVLELPDETMITQIRIRTISGKLVYQEPYTKEISADFESGMYIIELMQNSSILGFHRLMID